MSPTGFRWFVCAVVAALVVVMLVVVRSNAWPARAPTIDAGEQRGASSLAHPASAMAAALPAGAFRDGTG